MFIRYVDEDQEMYRKSVTAYTSNIPIYVNGSDINQSSYPAINYRPSSDKPYYSYVPIASFSKVGAAVNYDSVSNVINVTTDYYLNKDTITQQQNRIKELEDKYNKLEEQIGLCLKDFVQYNGIVDGYSNFGGMYWQAGNGNGFTIGHCYKIIEGNEEVMTTQYMSLLNDNNEKVQLSTSIRNGPAGIIYIGKAENGLHSFAWQASVFISDGSSKFKVIKPSDGNISLEPGKIYLVTRSDDYINSVYKEYQIVGTDIVFTTVK